MRTASPGRVGEGMADWPYQAIRQADEGSGLPSLIARLLSYLRRLRHLKNRRRAECLGCLFRPASDELCARTPTEEARAQSRIPRTRQTTDRNHLQSYANSSMASVTTAMVN
jgi:hypothetical protein